MLHCVVWLAVNSKDRLTQLMWQHWVPFPTIRSQNLSPFYTMESTKSPLPSSSNLFTTESRVKKYLTVPALLQCSSLLLPAHLVMFQYKCSLPHKTEFKGWRKPKLSLGFTWISGKMGLFWQNLFQILRKIYKWWVRLQSSQTTNCSAQWVFPVILGLGSPWKKCQDTAFVLQNQANMPSPFPAILQPSQHNQQWKTRPISIDCPQAIFHVSAKCQICLCWVWNHRTEIGQVSRGVKVKWDSGLHIWDWDL